MSMSEVAELAGVSVATVSRVINNSGQVSSETTENVRRIISETNFKRQRAPRQAASKVAKRDSAQKFGMLIIGRAKAGDTRSNEFDQWFHSGVFQRLLQGVSNEAAKHDLEMAFSFVPADGEIPKSVLGGNVNGVLLHGKKPMPAMESVLRKLPSVWLMANDQRAEWGDQVMPDNLGIGELAASHLVARGHRRVAFVSGAWDGWYWKTRASSFVNQCLELGTEAIILPAGALNHSVKSFREKRTPDELADQLMKLKKRPTGLFVGEDAQVPQIVAAVQKRGLSAGPNGDIDIVSCNNDRIHFAGLSDIPATMDIQAEAIGRRGVQLLATRMSEPNGERVRTLIEPLLVDVPAAKA